jgi:1-acyl-sn-glycerol-3-phosphate acyltransferase|tara:strand:+ start:442 stop:1143 length:702 start_codon:yes stop_codon:yes gene_type:complete
MIRNFLFSIFFFGGIFFISMVFIPAFFLPQKIILFGGKIMGLWTSFCLKFFLSTKLVVKGKENIISHRKFFIASSHQSMFETFFLQTIFNSPVFILKKELLLIPIFGWYLKKIGSISIKRNKISKDNLGFFTDISKLVNSSNRPLVIFPQGTRLLPEDRMLFKKGASRIYEKLKIPCQPIAINSGFTWPKYGPKKIKTTLIISILEPIEPGQDKVEFLKNLQSVIYNELDALN